jgi:hypothetical protein
MQDLQKIFFEDLLKEIDFEGNKKDKEKFVKILIMILDDNNGLELTDNVKSLNDLLNSL